MAFPEFNNVNGGAVRSKLLAIVRGFSIATVTRNYCRITELETRLKLKYGRSLNSVGRLLVR